MRQLTSVVDVRDELYRANRTTMLARLADIDALLEPGRRGGSEASVARHRARGRLLARERIELLVDPHSHFFELSPLAAWGTDFAVGASLITGIGVISDIECVIIANDPTVRGGTMNPYTSRKSLRAMAIAAQNRLPLIQLTESGGGDLPTQAESFVDGGRMFMDLSRLSLAKIPTIDVVFGNATAGGAYQPGMSDYAILVRGHSKVFLGGPPLVKMATGEIADAEELGGADMHASVSGTADYVAGDELDALRIARDVVTHLRWERAGYEPISEVDEPLHDPEDLLGIVSADVRVPFDPGEVIARITDGSRFEEFKPSFGPTLMTGWAYVHGFPVGLIANRGILFAEAADKAAQFIGLCNQRDIPLIFMQNTTGFMVGKAHEQRGIIKAGSRMLRAVSNSSVPRITLMMGASYGAGHYGMSGRGYFPRFVLAWPNQRVGIMGPRQMAGVLSIVAREKAERTGQIFDEAADAERQRIIEQQLERESDALFATGRMWDDGIIDPRDTRTVLGICLSAVHNAPVVGSTDLGPVRA